jgi:hypothetical protein
MVRLMVLALVGCTPTTAPLVELPADAAQTLTMVPPYGWEHIVLGSTTDWDLITVPPWSRQCLIKNEHASGTLLVGDKGSTGVINLTTSEYGTVVAGGAVSVPLTAGQSNGNAADLVVPLGSATASLPVGVYCTQAAY